MYSKSWTIYCHATTDSDFNETDILGDLSDLVLTKQKMTLNAIILDGESRITTIEQWPRVTNWAGDSRNCESRQYVSNQSTIDWSSWCPYEMVNQSDDIRNNIILVQIALVNRTLSINVVRECIFKYDRYFVRFFHDFKDWPRSVIVPCIEYIMLLLYYYHRGYYHRGYVSESSRCNEG